MTYTFDDFVEIIRKLRDPESGCPWDLKQTHETLRPYMIEEAYELVEAITHQPEKIAEELGDVLLQVVLHSQIGSDNKEFSIEQVIQLISEKIISRHPHVFGDKKVSDAEDVTSLWEEQKAKERAESKGLLDGVPKALPALSRANQYGERCSRVGFDWQGAEDVLPKVEEEFSELKEAGPDKKAEELGDLLFTLAQYGRKLGIDPEQCLQDANHKFLTRLQLMEEKAEVPLSELSAEEKEGLWKKVKLDLGNHRD